MFSATAQIEIKRSPEDAYDFTADLRNEVNWNPLIKSSTLTSGEPIQLGSRFTVNRKGSGVQHMEITVFDRPTSFSISGRFRGGSYTYTGKFTSTGEGTLVVERIEMTLRGPMMLLTPLIKGKLGKDLVTGLGQRKAVLEAR